MCTYIKRPNTVLKPSFVKSIATNYLAVQLMQVCNFILQLIAEHHMDIVVFLMQK